MVGKFILRQPTLAILNPERTGIAVPAGAFIEIVLAPLEGAKLVDVLWHGRAIFMFCRDIATRADQVP